LTKNKIWENDGEGESKIHCKHFCKCHSGPPEKQKYANK
jgi:hypothetical protein